MTHPEAGPFGESVYFRDPTGNFLEVLWRRDEDADYVPVRPLGHGGVVKSLGCVGRRVIVGVAIEGRVGDHERRVALTPE